MWTKLFAHVEDLYRNHTEQYPGLVVGTGAEDYFDSS